MTAQELITLSQPFDLLGDFPYFHDLVIRGEDELLAISADCWLSAPQCFQVCPLDIHFFETHFSAFYVGPVCRFPGFEFEVPVGWTLHSSDAFQYAPHLNSIQFLERLHLVTKTRIFADIQITFHAVLLDCFI